MKARKKDEKSPPDVLADLYIWLDILYLVQLLVVFNIRSPGMSLNGYINALIEADMKQVD